MATVDHVIGAEAETFFAAVHEIGHVVVLPNSFKAHVSLKNPCRLCPEGEGKAYSLAHVGHRSDTALDPIPEILYSLSGGAAEIACGLNPVQVKFSYGTFPQSMGQDFIDLKAEMMKHRVPWRVLAPAIPDAFELICRFFETHRERVLYLAKRLITERELQARDSLTFPEREIVIDQLTVQFGAN